MLHTPLAPTRLCAATLVPTCVFLHAPALLLQLHPLLLHLHPLACVPPHLYQHSCSCTHLHLNPLLLHLHPLACVPPFLYQHSCYCTHLHLNPLLLHLHSLACALPRLCQLNPPTCPCTWLHSFCTHLLACYRACADMHAHARTRCTKGTLIVCRLARTRCTKAHFAPE